MEVSSCKQVHSAGSHIALKALHTGRYNLRLPFSTITGSHCFAKQKRSSRCQRQSGFKTSRVFCAALPESTEVVIVGAVKLSQLHSCFKVRRSSKRLGPCHAGHLPVCSSISAPTLSYTHWNSAYGRIGPACDPANHALKPVCLQSCRHGGIKLWVPSSESRGEICHSGELRCRGRACADRQGGWISAGQRLPDISHILRGGASCP